MNTLDFAVSVNIYDVARAEYDRPYYFTDQDFIYNIITDSWPTAAAILAAANLNSDWVQGEGELILESRFKAEVRLIPVQELTDLDAFPFGDPRIGPDDIQDTVLRINRQIEVRREWLKSPRQFFSIKSAEEWMEQNTEKGKVFRETYHHYVECRAFIRSNFRDCGAPGGTEKWWEIACLDLQDQKGGDGVRRVLTNDNLWG